MSLLATSRYIFEALVWARTIQKDERYSLVLYHQLAVNSVQQAMEHKNKVEDEILLFEHLSAEEDKLTKTLPKEDFNAENLQFIEDEIDRRARREFSIYAEDAKLNGQSFQAYLLRQKGLVQIDARIVTVALEQKNLEDRLAPDVRQLTKLRWNWRQQAKSVGMDKQYDFIYSHTSRMLHATPFSFIVN